MSNKVEIARARGDAAVAEALGEKANAKLTTEYVELLEALDNAKGADAHKAASRALFEFRQKWRGIRDYNQAVSVKLTPDPVTGSAQAKG